MKLDPRQINKINEHLFQIQKPSPMAQTPDCSFVLSVEQGKLESQAVLLVESLRQFGGTYANCPVYAISPRPSRQIGAACHAALTTLGVHIIVEDLLPPDEAYGTVARMVSCAWAERTLTSEILVSLDDDLFFISEPNFRLEGVDFFARPVDVKGICTCGPSDSLDAYWREIAQVTEVDYDEIPWLETTVDRIRVKASYNGGMIATRRDVGVFQRAEKIFRILQKNDLSPYSIGQQEVFASTGFVGTEASRWWGSAQAALSLAATQLKAKISIAPSSYNVPIHLAKTDEAFGSRITLDGAILIHYHWLLDKEHTKEATIFYGSSSLPSTIQAWLKTKTPLSETYLPPHQANHQILPPTSDRDDIKRNMPTSLKGKVVLITGASSGFGEDAALLFAREGASVVLAARRIERLQDLVAKIHAEGGNAMATPVDVTNRADIHNMVKSVIENYKHIDILFNNAGFGRLDWLENLDMARDIQTQIAVNLTGLIEVTHAVLPHMITHKSGQIINMSSVAGWIGAPLYSVYAATKFGVRGFNDALRREVGIYGIKVTGIYPGPATTEFSQHTGDNVFKRSFKAPRWAKLTSAYVAQKVVDAAKHPRRTVILPWWYHFVFWADFVVPGIVDWVLNIFFVSRYHRK